jgi:Spy/CpxP family protein refolding chaperone
MRVPVTDAFDDTDQLESLKVELTTRQVDWIRQQADEQDLSFDHMLRSVITAQIREQCDPEGEDPAPPAADSPQPASGDETAGTADVNGGSSSIVDSLRSASERLQDLTEQDDAAEAPDPHDTLERLQARLGDSSDTGEAEEEAQGSFVVENQDRSMFDMMDDA